VIQVTASIAIPEGEIHEEFVRSSGPGGQNVNKVSTAVELRFDVRNSPSLPREVRDRLVRLAGRRITAEGVLIIDARRFRTQEQNRRDALNRLVDLIRAAAIRPKVRRATSPTVASRRRRLQSKLLRSRLKEQRRRVAGED
jgi:ribosome-associated protein